LQSAALPSFIRRALPCTRKKLFEKSFLTSKTLDGRKLRFRQKSKGLSPVKTAGFDRFFFASFFSRRKRGS
jgi:hypothetical protein